MTRQPDQIAPGDSYRDLLVWKWRPRGLQWEAEYKGARLIVRCRKRPRRGTLWKAEVMTPNGYEWNTSGRFYANADLAQQDALEILKRYMPKICTECKNSTSAHKLDCSEGRR